KIISNIARGSTNKNKERHGKTSIIQPDKVGPIHGANTITNPAIPMANPRVSLGQISIITVIIHGIIIHAPDACITRTTINTEKFVLNKQTIVPKEKINIDVINNLRVVNVSISKAVIGIIIPLTSMNIVVIH